MKVRLIAALAATAAAVFTSVAAEAAPILTGPAYRGPAVFDNPVFVPVFYSLTCVVRGTPVEFPSDVVIRNNSPYTVPAGKWIFWKVHNEASGWKYLNQPLAPGASFTLFDVIPGGWPAESVCTAEVK